MTARTPRARLEHLRRPRAFLFDLDGTLVDTVGTRVRAWLDVFPHFGIEPDPGFLGTLMGSDGRMVAREAAASVGRTLDPGLDAEIDRLAGERFGRLNVEPRALRGAAELLELLERSGTPWAIATSSRPDEAVASVRAMGLRGEPHVVDGGDVEHAKPAPDLLLKGADHLGLPPEDHWYVGDSKWDMLAAVAAGMVPIGVPSGATSAETLREAGAAEVFDDLAALHRHVAAEGLLPDATR